MPEVQLKDLPKPTEEEKCSALLETRFENRFEFRPPAHLRDPGPSRGWRDNVRAIHSCRAPVEIDKVANKVEIIVREVNCQEKALRSLPVRSEPPTGDGQPSTQLDRGLWPGIFTWRRVRGRPRQPDHPACTRRKRHRPAGAYAWPGVLTRSIPPSRRPRRRRPKAGLLAWPRVLRQNVLLGRRPPTC